MISKEEEIRQHPNHDAFCDVSNKKSMKSPLQVTVLGCGTSTGVPVIGCNCAVCSSNNPRNRRLRSSVWISSIESLDSNSASSSILFDATPDFRTQALTSGIKQLDGVFFSHAHADHVLGIEDLRILSFSHPDGLPVYGSEQTLEEIKKMFAYIFSPAKHHEGGKVANLRPQVILPGETIIIGDISVQAIPIFHGNLPIFGYRIGSFFYATDCSYIPEDSFSYLSGVSTLLIDGLRYEPHPTHFSVKESIAVSNRIKPNKTYLTHMAHSIEYESLLATLPSSIEPAYDGLQFLISD
jgi:phosphoribosyl 1,2-cyclic phosphate phosphodiesterase